MSEEKDILKQLNHRDGRTVPDGYFADFAQRMAASLEPTPFEQSAPALAAPVKRTFWQRVRPYAYMAAMFAGVWCMLKMFTLMTGDPKSSLDLSPAFADALGNETFVNEYILDDIRQSDIFDELMDEGVEVDEISLDSISADIDDTDQQYILL